MDPTELPLRDIHLPEPVGWWPLAPGWWLLAAIIAGLLVWRLVQALRQHRELRPLREARQRLKASESAYLEHRNPVLLAGDISTLLRRATLAYAPRNEVAGLTGDAWLQWLDKGLPVPWFQTEGGKRLVELPYRDPDSAPDDADINALLAAAHTRLETPFEAAR